MVVHDLDVVGIAIPPLEADSVAVIDADTVLPFPVGFERLQMKALGSRRSLSEVAAFRNRSLIKAVLSTFLYLRLACRSIRRRVSASR
jgi:hypothetical protein